MKMILKLKFLFVLFLCYTGLFVVNLHAQTICNNEMGILGGYFYEFWKDSGSGCMTLNEGGTFSCEWSDVNNIMFRRGLKFDRTPYPDVGEIRVEYGADYQPDGVSSMGVYGWFTDPLVEYFIVDNWGTWRPQVISSDSTYTSYGTFDVDGGTYDVFECLRRGPIDGPVVLEYWSVRTEKRTSGIVSVSKHFAKWASLDLDLGNLYDVTFMVDGYQSNGQADVYSLEVDVNNGDDDDDDDDDDDYTEITAPFIKEGAGCFKWIVSAIPWYVNSWCLDSLVINGVDYTNAWVSSLHLPSKQDGYYYIEYQASYPWSHIEIK